MVAVRWCPDGSRLLATASMDGTARLWQFEEDEHTGQWTSHCVNTLEGHLGSLTDLVFDRCGGVLVRARPLPPSPRWLKRVCCAALCIRPARGMPSHSPAAAYLERISSGRRALLEKTTGVALCIETVYGTMRTMSDRSLPALNDSTMQPPCYPRVSPVSALLTALKTTYRNLLGQSRRAISSPLTLLFGIKNKGHPG